MSDQIKELIQKGKSEFFLGEQYDSGKEFHGCFTAEINHNKVTITKTFPKKTINIDYKVNAKFDETRQSIVDVNGKLIQGAKKLKYIPENTITGTNEHKIDGFFTAKITQNGITFTNIYLGECSMSDEMQNSLQPLKNKRRKKLEVKEPAIQPEVKEPAIQPEVKEPAIQLEVKEPAIETALVIAEQLRINATELRNANKKLNSAYDNYNKYFYQATKAYDSVKNINFVGNQIFGMNADKIKDMYNSINDEYNTIKSQWDKIMPPKKDDISKAKDILKTCAGLLAKFAVLLEHYKYAYIVKAKGGRKTRKLRPRNSSDKSRPS